MKYYYDTLADLQKVRGSYEVTKLIGNFRASNPAVLFVDEYKTVFTEQWSIEGRYRGWIEEAVSDREYFRRKLKGE